MGGLLMLSTAYLFHWLKYPGVNYAIWCEQVSAKVSEPANYNGHSVRFI
jgi:hypothetical protein